MGIHLKSTNSIPPTSKHFRTTVCTSSLRIAKNLFIGTDNGLNLYNPQNGSFRRFQNIPNDPASISSNIISSIAEDKDGVVWVGTNNGLNALNTANWSFSALFSNKANVSTLSSSVISSLLVDKSGTLWVGTASNGLNAFDTKTKRAPVIKTILPTRIH